MSSVAGHVRHELWLSFDDTSICLKCVINQVDADGQVA